jgi:lipopolysaccharide transport system permease protein
VKDAATYELVIEPGRADRTYWADLWRYRELFAFLAWRDIAVRYKQTAIGIAWAVIQPLAMMAIFTFTFRGVAGMSSDPGAPYAVMVMVGTLAWHFFSTGFSSCSSSLVGNANLLTKVYFPRLIVPTSAVVVSLVDFVIGFALLLALCLFFSYIPNWRIVFLPVFMLLTFGLSLGLGLVVATLNVEYRDFRYVIPFLIQFGAFLSPVGYSTRSIAGNKYGFPVELYYLNPLAGVIDGYRWCLLGSEMSVFGVCVSAGVVVLSLLAGVKFFRRMEKTFADVI